MLNLTNKWTKSNRMNQKNVNRRFVNNSAPVRNSAPAGSSAGNGGTVGVRDYLTSAGLDPSKIGWADGKVTYAGRAYTPVSNVNGKTYGTKESMDSFISDIQRDNGNVGIRQRLTSVGLDPNKIGWSGGKVTYGGVSMTPAVNANGITYGVKNDVDDFARRAIASDGDELVQVNAYNPGNGMYDVGWNDAEKKVTVGGRELPYFNIDSDGNAWARKSVLQKAYDNLGKENGIQNPTETFNSWMKNYADKLDKKYDELSRDKFEYNLNSDPAYAAYRDMYKREADRAYEDALGEVAAKTGGNMSSMAMSQAAQQRDYYLSKLNDVVPQLVQLAWERYNGGMQNRMNALDRQNTLYRDIYGNEANARALALENYNKVRDGRQQRIDDSFSNQYNGLDLRQKQSDVDTQIAKNVYDTADMFNRPFTKEEAEQYSIPAYDDGTLPTTSEIAAQKQNAIWEGYEKGIYDYKRAAELEDELALNAAAAGIAIQKEQAKYAAQVSATAQKEAIKTSEQQKRKKNSGGAKNKSSVSSKSSSSGSMTVDDFVKALKG